MEKEKLAALGQMTYGIYVLTTGSGEEINGMIASWVSQVSYEPLLIMAAVHPNRYSHGLIEKSGAFGLHILDQSQKEMLSRFKGPDPLKKFQGLSWEPGQTGVPILKHCLAWFELRVKEHSAPGNHSLFLGEVLHSGCPASGTPLTTLDYEGMYTGKN